ncbi:hypothetical protein F511_24427 [Dorcoceras hygrometricum]|uniref:Uncharacterized protein n=1 Tax=Dorcoceras hygrometricum TaxID=472368 RepID=A0A2Z7CRA5_9LAMI|nr:hypothetical protein F511_24427 [Dorcoceras hygrometricum]
MISSSYICPSVGSQHKQPAVGLVFMESAAGLSLETSKVESVVRNQAEAKLNQLEHDEPAETMTTSCKRLREKLNQLVRVLRSALERITSKKKIPGAKRKRSDVVDEKSSRKLLFTSRCYLEISIAKRCRLHKLIRQRFALVLKIQQEDFALIASRKIQSQDTNWKHMFNTSWTTRRKQQQHPVVSLFEPDVAINTVSKNCNQAQSIQSTKISAEDEYSRCDKSAAKKLTIYESWMSTAERNSKWRKRQDAIKA